MKCPWLTECRSAFGDAQSHVDRLYAGLSAEQLEWKPAEDRWSVLQCIQHLVLVRETHVPMFRAAVQEGREQGITGGEAPYGAGTEFGRWLIELFENPEKQKSFPEFEPAGHTDPEEALEAFTRINGALMALVQDADGLDLGSIEVPAPKPEFGNLSLAQGFRMYVVHDARHLAQAEAVRQDPGFPAA